MSRNLQKGDDISISTKKVKANFYDKIIFIIILAFELRCLFSRNIYN